MCEAWAFKLFFVKPQTQTTPFSSSKTTSYPVYRAVCGRLVRDESFFSVGEQQEVEEVEEWNEQEEEERGGEDERVRRRDESFE